jgi:hypothetical protein
MVESRVVIPDDGSLARLESVMLWTTADILQESVDRLNGLRDFGLEVAVLVDPAMEELRLNRLERY